MWNCKPCVWPNVSAVPTFMILLSIVVEPDPKVATPVTLKFWIVENPVWTAPDACACIFTLPSESFNAVASIPVSCEPSPWNAVAVTTPNETIPFRAVIIPIESTLVTSSYVKTPLTSMLCAVKIPTR